MFVVEGLKVLDILVAAVGGVLDIMLVVGGKEVGTNNLFVN